MVRKYLQKNILESKRISERIAVLDMHLKDYSNKWSIIQVYAPTEEYDDHAKDLSYDLSSLILKDVHKNGMNIGDFNGRIGSQHPR